MSSREDESTLQEPVGGTKPIEIHSEDGTVTLRQFTLEDANEIFALIDRNREHLSQHGEDTAGKYPTLESVVKSIAEPSNPKRLRFAIRNEKGEFVGSINLTPDKEDPNRGEIGYYLGGEFTSKGYAGRAVEVLTRYGFKHLGYKEIFGVAAETNTPSINVLKRLGYTETGRRTTEKRNEIELSRFKPPAVPQV